MPGIAVANKIDCRSSWTRYWKSQDEVLFFAETKDIADGKLYNKKSGSSDYLTVTGAAGSYTFQCPDTAAYIAADTDYIWFEDDETPRETTEEELITYDFTRTIVKYDNTTPYTSRAIMILSSTLVSNSAKENKMRTDFWLSRWWDNTLSLYGYAKENRAAEKSVWPPDEGYCEEYQAVYDVFTTRAIIPSDADAIIQNTMLKAIVDGGYFAKAELLAIMGLHDAAALIDMKAPTGTHNPELVNAPTFTSYTGFKANQAGGKLVKHNFNLSTDLATASQNSICAMIGIMDDVKEAYSDFGVYTSAAGAKFFFMSGRTSSEQALTGCLTGSAEAAFSTVGTSKKHLAMSREGSANYDAYSNKNKNTLTSVSVALPNNEIYSGGTKQDAAVIASNKTIGYVFIFSGLTDAEVEGVTDIMEAYFDNYGTGLIS